MIGETLVCGALWTCCLTCGGAVSITGTAMCTGSTRCRSASGCSSGIRTRAVTIDPFTKNVAIIQLRLRVWMRPIDSNVESSNMFGLLEVSPAAPAGDLRRPLAHDSPRSPRAKPHRERSSSSSVSSPPEPLCWCRHRSLANCSRASLFSLERATPDVKGTGLKPVHQALKKEKGLQPLRNNLTSFRAATPAHLLIAVRYT